MNLTRFINVIFGGRSLLWLLPNSTFSRSLQITCQLLVELVGSGATYSRHDRTNATFFFRSEIKLKIVDISL